MKLPIPTLLYLCAAGLFGYAGWTVYKMLPLLDNKTNQDATSKGQKDGLDRLGKGKGQGPVTVDWQYTDRTAGWWAQFKAPNYIGKLPEVPVDPKEQENKVTERPLDVRPLEQIIELVSLTYDGSTLGKGGNSHVIVRYKPEANVQPPEWYMRENALDGAGGPATALPRDVAATRGGRPNQPRPNAPMPTSMVGREIQQMVWIDGGDDVRRTATLWGEFDNIKLVRVAPDAQSAFFVRTPPPPKEGEPAVEPKEEELIKTNAAISQDLLRELRVLQGRSPTEGGQRRDVAAGAQNTWIESESTTQVGNRWNIGRQDEKRFRDPDELLTQIHVDTYVSNHSDTRGLVVRGIDPQIASNFGIAQQDVLLEINSRKVQTQAQAMQFVKGEYNKGVRTYVTQWLSNGQIVERIYQAPDK
ncbi:MAG: hypothetical protein H6838_20490 [Planctomycetes bacterium]|nr:hypothetical protein [Planctomycetota bacterium]MCB9887870.1 hypothetical protein [Planctomycetota bacterium]